jgi:hypothetical protein
MLPELAMTPDLESLYHPGFEASLHEMLWTFPEPVRGPAILFAVDAVANSIQNGGFAPDPALNLSHFVFRKARWKALELLRKKARTSSELDHLPAREVVAESADLERAVLFAAMFTLAPRQRVALMSDEKEPWLHQVEMFLRGNVPTGQAAVADFSGFPGGSSFAMAKTHARTALAQMSAGLPADPSSFSQALAEALRRADAELVNDTQLLRESPLSCLGAQYAAAAIAEAAGRGIEIPVSFATEVALRLDVSNRSDLALAILDQVLPRAASPVLEAQVVVARATVLDHQAGHEHSERRYESAYNLLKEGSRSISALLSSGTPLPDQTSWWLKYQCALLRRRLCDVRRDQGAADPPPGDLNAADVERSLGEILRDFESLQGAAHNLGQRLAVMHQLAVVHCLLADVQRPNAPSAARKRYEDAEQLLQQARWLAVAHGENQGRRFAYGFRRLGLVLAALSDLAESPKKRDALRSQAFNELEHAMSVAQRHGFLRLQSQISRDIARLFPS